MEGSEKLGVGMVPLPPLNGLQNDFSRMGGDTNLTQEPAPPLLLRTLESEMVNQGSFQQEVRQNRQIGHHDDSSKGFVMRNSVHPRTNVAAGMGRVGNFAAMPSTNANGTARNESIDHAFPMNTFPNAVDHSNTAVEGSVFNDHNHPHALLPPLEVSPKQTNAASVTVTCLQTVMEQLSKVLQFSQNRQQLMDLSLNSSDPADMMELCQQSFQAIINQVNQTQQSVRNALNMIQQEERQQQQQQQIGDKGFVSFPTAPFRQYPNGFPPHTHAIHPSQQRRPIIAHNNHAASGSLDRRNSDATTNNNDDRGIQPVHDSTDEVQTGVKSPGQAHPKKRRPTISAQLAGYKRRKEPPLPQVPPPDDNAKQYTKQQAMDILVNSGAGDTPTDRNRLIGDWIARNLVPVTAHTTMNKYVRQFRESGGVVDQEWERVDDVDEHGIPQTTRVPEPANKVEYTRREAIQILMQLNKEKKISPRDRNLIITSWIAQRKIPVKSINVVERNIQQAENDGLESIQEHWGRWGDTQHEKRVKKMKTVEERRKRIKAASANRNQGEINDTSLLKATTSKKESSSAVPHLNIPPHPAPLYGNEYTKLEAVGILQKIADTQDRTNIIWKWIHSKQIPITHPNSMARILRDAKNGTLKNIDWRESSSHATLPWTPDPRNGSMYSKAEMIDILSKMNSSDRNKVVRVWVHEKKVPYTSSLSANHAVIKAIREQYETEALSKGENPKKRVNASIAATGPARKKKKRGDDEANNTT
ncbi:hypothetical protein IV203_008032 [Nitzschia inconspicua]|uniref:Uncharacterized protein n=1 Tax=Nitzschia inconspicua TaxID=303405 RepID=A0A9K3KYW6_9STRA|nr:hypothetical protein IV203_008032 [Nitzschia inconspicua]